MEKFTVSVEIYKGCWDARHVLEANDAKHATEMVNGWASYHGFNRSEVKIEASQGNEVNWEVSDFWRWFT